MKQTMTIQVFWNLQSCNCQHSARKEITEYYSSLSDSVVTAIELDWLGIEKSLSSPKRSNFDDASF